MNQKLFRLLLLLFIGCTVACIVVAAVVAYGRFGYSVGLAEAYEKEPESFFLQSPWLIFGIGVPLAIAGISGVVGLYKFKPWGRSLSLYSTAIGLMLYPFLGPTLSSGLESAFVEVSNLLWGGILALSYYSPISHHFNANRAIQTTHEDAHP